MRWGGGCDWVGLDWVVCPSVCPFPCWIRIGGGWGISRRGVVLCFTRRRDGWERGERARLCLYVWGIGYRVYGFRKKHVASGFSVLKGSFSDMVVRVLASWTLTRRRLDV